MKKKIIEIAEKAGISQTGFCSADLYRRQKCIMPEIFASGKDDMPPDTKTIIVCLFSYYNGEKRGNISGYAQGKDYHRVAAEKMNSITAYLEKEGFWAESYADTGSLNERMAAQLSGLAFRGKNRMMISDKFGSYFFIGYVLTDCMMAGDAAEDRVCMNCGKCVKACPAKVLGNVDFDEKKCLSYITQKKGELSEDEKELIKKTGFIWGCDICQEVCPHNQGIEITDIDEFKTDLIIDLKLPEGMSNREFKRIYGNRAFAWRGKGVLTRNSEILKK